MELIICLLSLYGIIKLFRTLSARAREQKRQEEAIRVKREQMWQKEMLRQAKDIERHEAQLKKHDEQIAKLRGKAYQAGEDIEFLKERVNRLRKLAEYEELERDASVPYGSEYQKHEKKLISYENQIRTANRQLEKAYSILDEAERKLAEAS